MKNVNGISNPLLLWYAENARDLSWRKDPTPYKIWISEVIFQQTRIEAGKSYFERFIEKLPDVRALAAVSDEELLKLWEGLGYYRRAYNLKRAAQIVVNELQSEIPGSFTELRKLPGLGDYSAGAIASIAFRERVPAVDGNVMRIFARLLADDRDIMLPVVKKEWTALIAQLVPEENPGDFNQALMELGALICRPNAAPLCEKCPLCAYCKAYRIGAQTNFPVKGKTKEKKIEEKTVFVLRFHGKTALFKRPEKGLLSGMWEYYCAQEKLAHKEAEAFLKKSGIAFECIARLIDSEHIFTHIKWKMAGYMVELSKVPDLAGLVWADVNELSEVYAIPSAYGAYTNRKQ